MSQPRAAHIYVKLTARDVKAAYAKWLRPDDLVEVVQDRRRIRVKRPVPALLTDAAPPGKMSNNFF